MKAIPDGVVSNHLVRRAQPGTLIQLDQAQGDFVLPDPARAKVLFLTAGSGITPVMGMLRDGALTAADVVLVHSAPTAGRRHLRRRAARAWPPRARSGWSSGTPTPTACSTSTELDDLVPDHCERQTWACGPIGLLDAVEEHWAGRRRRRAAAHRAVPADGRLARRGRHGHLQHAPA